MFPKGPIKEELIPNIAINTKLNNVLFNHYSMTYMDQVENRDHLDQEGEESCILVGTYYYTCSAISGTLKTQIHKLT